MQGLNIGPNVNLGFAYDGIKAHSMATLSILLYADITAGGITDWKAAAKYFWPVMYDDAFAEDIGMGQIEGQAKADGDFSGILRQVIAYSAIDEGTRVFGDTGIRAFYNDANDFGRAVTANPAAGILTNFAPHISKVFIEYAADLALNKIESAKVSFGFIQPLNGVLQFFGSGNILAMDFSKDVWSAAGDSDITSRRLFVDGLIGDPLATYRPIRDLMNTAWGTSSSDIFDVAYIVQNGGAANDNYLPRKSQVA